MLLSQAEKLNAQLVHLLIACNLAMHDTNYMCIYMYNLCLIFRLNSLAEAYVVYVSSIVNTY